MNKLLMASMISAVGLVGTAAHAQDAEPAYGWTDDAPVEATIDRWRPVLRDAPYFETWDYWFWTDDGEFIYLQYVVSTLGFGIERQGSVRGTVIQPGAVSLGEVEEGVFRARRGFEYDEGAWSFEPEGFRMNFEELTMGGDGQTFDLTMFDNTIKFEASMVADSELFVPGDGMVECGWDRAIRYSLDVLPRFSFEGRLSTRRTRSAEETWRDVRGVGFAKHTRTAGLPVTVGSQWLSFRALRADGLTIIVENQVAPADYGGASMPWALVLLDGRVVFASTDVSISQTDVRPEEHPPSVYSVPYAYDIVATSGDDRIVVHVNNAQLVQQDNILSRVSRIVRAVLANMMNPMDYDFTVDYEALIEIDGVAAQAAGRGWSTVNFPR